jgi:replicative DNA helicase Mcm
MYVRSRNNQQYSLKEAQSIMNTKVNYKKWGRNPILDIPTFTLPTYTIQRGNAIEIRNQVTLNMNDWLEFLGIYLSEGCINENSVQISAHKQRVKSKLITLCNTLHFNYKNSIRNPNYIYIHDCQLASYLCQFGKSYNKFLPDYVLKLSANQAELLLNGLLLGDGYFDNRRGSWEFYTGSRKLADGAQILAILSGQSARITEKNQAGEVVIINGIQTIRNSIQYRVYITQYKPSMEPLVGGNGTSESLINYNNKVYCIEVPNHIFMVRRAYKHVWTGNSSRAGQFWLQVDSNIYLVLVCEYIHKPRRNTSIAGTS